MELKRGDMFAESKADLILFTANGVVKRDGSLVMGAGAAKQAARLYPELPALLGRALRQRFRPGPGGVYRYHLAYSSKLGAGAFQTKLHYRDPSPLELVRASAEVLAEDARRNPGRRYAVNLPGTGLGGLEAGVVLEVLEELWRDLPIEVWSRS